MYVTIKFSHSIGIGSRAFTTTLLTRWANSPVLEIVDAIDVRMIYST